MKFWILIVMMFSFSALADNHGNATKEASEHGGKSLGEKVEALDCDSLSSAAAVESCKALNMQSEELEADAAAKAKKASEHGGEALKEVKKSSEHGGKELKSE